MKSLDKNVGKYIDLGLQFAVAIALGVFLGHFLDSKIGTSPILLIVGLLLGSAAGFLNIYRVVFPKDQESSTSKQEKSER